MMFACLQPSKLLWIFLKFYLLLSHVQSYYACFHATMHVISRMPLLDKYNRHSSLHIHHKISENDKVAKLKIIIRLAIWIFEKWICELQLTFIKYNHTTAMNFDVFSFCFLLENCCISLYTSQVTDQWTNPLSFSIFLSCASNLNNFTNVECISMHINS